MSEVGDACAAPPGVESKEPVPRDQVRRRFRGNAALWGNVALAAVIVLELNYLAFRHFERWDWTASGAYTLSERTVLELESLEQPVDFYLFMSAAEPKYAELRELLERYRSKSRRFAVHYVDPHSDPARYRRLARRFDVKTLVDEAGVEEADVVAVMASGTRRTTIQKTDLLSLDLNLPDDEEGAKVDVRAEQAITGALVQVLASESTRLCSTTGHGEWAIDGSGARSLRGAVDEMRREQVEIVPQPTRGVRTIEPTCDAVMIVAPTTAFSTTEQALLRDYLRQGGNLFVALDVVIDDGAFADSGLGALLAEVGIEATRAVILEENPALLLRSNPIGPFLVASYGRHETTAPLATSQAEAPTQFFEARAIQATEGSPADALLLTSELSWGETDIQRLTQSGEAERGADDVGERVSVAVASQFAVSGTEDGETPHGGRVLVVGDADWLSPSVLQNPQWLNDDLFRVWVGWLTSRRTLVAIAPASVDAVPMRITQDSLGFGLSGLGLRLLVLMPAAFVLLGFGTWWSRRQ